MLVNLFLEGIVLLVIFYWTCTKIITGEIELSSMGEVFWAGPSSLYIKINTDFSLGTIDHLNMLELF